MRSLALIVVMTSLALADDPPSAWKEKPVTAADREHWAFRPPVRLDVPRPKDAGRVRNPIDAFILSRLEQTGLKPSPEASKAALIRRVTFDLTGLPPTPEEVLAFEKDDRPGSYERVVDRLLASPHHGERWAQHWLDLARYADTDGFEFDQARPNAWRYRDWVVDALNRDLPYDQFIRLQLAGDEVAPDDPSGFVATGFSRCFPDMVDLNDQGLRRQNALNDITETTGLVFLGLTIGCARCHDHKFDPIRQSDFYRLQAFFTPSRFRDDYPVAGPEARRDYERRRRERDARMGRLQAAVIGLEAPVRERFAPSPAGATDDVIVALQKSAVDRTIRETALVFEAQAKDRRVKEPTYLAFLGPTSATVRKVLIAQIEAERKGAPPSLPMAIGIDESGGPPPPTYLLKRGEYTNKGPIVEPDVPRVLRRDDSRPVVIQPTKLGTGRRTALADWLVNQDNPLTARVIVNRLWQHHMGKGLVVSSSDFGLQGTSPTHPDLLDWLATELPRRGWSLKSIHRLIVTSAVYRQDSRADLAAVAADPSNDLLWRQNRRRLDGEAIRDALLATSGRFNAKLGGPCVFPELPAELMKLSNKGAVWPVSPREEDRNRRSLYVFTRRNLRFPFFEVFDRPDSNASCPARPVSTIAPQALTLLNSKLARDSARDLALRVRKEKASVEGRVDLVYRLTLGRAPDPVERHLALEFLEGAGEGGMEDFCLAIFNLNEFVYVD
jgi:hypothetical protein